MLLKLLFLLFVLYLVAKTFRSLIRAISEDGAPSQLGNERRGPEVRRPGASPSVDTHEDVEDARFVDI
jgi:hypothetical protein